MLHKIIVNEGAEAANITGMYAPTNGLLKPEFAPIQSKSKTPKTEPLDDLIDLDKLADNITPGKGAQYAQKDNKSNNTEIVNNLTKRTKTLFDRDQEGKVSIPGIHDNPKSINKQHSSLLRHLVTTKSL